MTTNHYKFRGYCIIPVVTNHKFTFTNPTSNQLVTYLVYYFGYIVTFPKKVSYCFVRNRHPPKTFKSILHCAEGTTSILIIYKLCHSLICEQSSVDFTNKRSQAKVYKMYFGISSV